MFVTTGAMKGAGAMVGASIGMSVTGLKAKGWSIGWALLAAASIAMIAPSAGATSVGDSKAVTVNTTHVNANCRATVIRVDKNRGTMQFAFTGYARQTSGALLGQVDVDCFVRTATEEDFWGANNFPKATALVGYTLPMSLTSTWRVCALVWYRPNARSAWDITERCK